MKKFLFVDLDDTLFQTVAKCSKDSDLHPAAYLKNGEACSFTTARQRAFFSFVHGEMTLIPTTARNRDALSRVDLPFSSYAIIDYGGIILQPNGEVDAAWLAIMQADMQQARVGLQAIMHIMDSYSTQSGLHGRARLIEDYATPFYVVLKDPEKKAERLAQVENEAVSPWLKTPIGQDFFVHRNGNNLAILPKTLNKARAVAYLRQRLEAEHGEIMTLGMGDSESDARFMASCDYTIIPKGTQLAARTVAAL